MHPKIILAIKAILTASLLTTGKVPGKAISTGLTLQLGVSLNEFFALENTLVFVLLISQCISRPIITL